MLCENSLIGLTRNEWLALGALTTRAKLKCLQSGEVLRFGVFQSQIYLEISSTSWCCNILKKEKSFRMMIYLKEKSEGSVEPASLFHLLNWKESYFVYVKTLLPTCCLFLIYHSKTLFPL